MRKPDLFLVGAAKSGTTSMETYLSQHPQVFISPRSEVHHFGTDLTVRYRVEDRAAYLALFAEAGEAVAVGEKSIGYLFSKTAAQEILDFNPDSRIVIMLRNPADMVHSLHRQFVRSGNEDLIDFREALAAQPARRRGQRLPPTCHKPEMLQYDEVVTYAPQVKRYLDRFGTRVAVILFEDLKSDAAGSYRRVLELVGAETEFAPSFEVHNPTIDLPSVAVRRVMTRFPMAAATLRRVAPPDLRRRLRRASARLQQQPDRRLDPVLRAEILERCEDDIVALGTLIGRDLSTWRV